MKDIEDIFNEADEKGVPNSKTQIDSILERKNSLNQNSLSRNLSSQNSLNQITPEPQRHCATDRSMSFIDQQINGLISRKELAFLACKTDTLRVLGLANQIKRPRISYVNPVANVSLQMLLA